MGKIYEALEKAQRERERKGEKKPPLFVVLPPGERPSGGFEVAAENEMVALSRNIDALLEASPRKVIQFIGPQGGEGASTVIRDFAMVSAARFGKSVLLLDADPRSPSQHLFFRLQPQFGWDEILRNKRTFRKAICRIGKTSLYVYPTPPGPASLPEALFSPGIKEFWEAAKEKFDLVLIDSAPASASPDGIGLSRFVDGVILVLEAEKTRKPVAESLKNQILQNGGKILGMVFNNRRYHIPEFVYRRL
jgi:capsular exopolysaccharide synthesis family protein